MQRNSLPAALVMLGWSYSCLSMVVSFHVKENPEISCTKGGTMYGEWLALHQVLVYKLCICIHAWNRGSHSDPQACLGLYSVSTWDHTVILRPAWRCTVLVHGITQ